MPEVEMASSGFFSPASGGVAYTNVSYGARPDLHLNVDFRWGDTNYLKLYQIKIMAGRNVRPDELLVNETYARLLGFQHPEAILNKQLNLNGKLLPVVGVMKDFHEESLHSPIGPVVFAGNTGPIFHIRLRPQDAEGQAWQRGIGKIQKAYQQIYPDADFSYAFLDDTLAGLYKTEERYVAPAGMGHGADDLYKLPGNARACYLYYEYACEGDRSEKGAGCVGDGYRVVAVKGFCAAGGDCFSYRCSHCVVGGAQMAGRLCVSYIDELVGIRD